MLQSFVECLWLSGKSWQWKTYCSAQKGERGARTLE